jgi:hypothetical protein
MKRFILFLVILFILSPLPIYAHGGVEKTATDATVTLFQDPISPLVGEKVNFTFIVNKAYTNDRLLNKSVRLEVIETTTGDASKDKVVYKKNIITDVNGIVSFSYVFSKTNFHDIELQFGKENDELDSAGFLVQPRENYHVAAFVLFLLVIILLAINFFFILKLRSKK